LTAACAFSCSALSHEIGTPLKGQPELEGRTAALTNPRCNPRCAGGVESPPKSAQRDAR
jgi:putative component of membrane protein insertase Oxa1/YidC/SpoIIIJ protein YidD